MTIVNADGGMYTPALGINIQGLNKNLQEVGENKYAISGTTPKNFDGFGQVQNMCNTDDVAYFFSDYAKDATNMNGPGCNLQITTLGNDSGGRKLIEDIVTRAGDDLLLSEEELQAWADEIGYTGDIKSVMEAMGDMDDYLCGKGTLDVEYVDSKVDEATSATEPTDSTNPDENATADADDDENNSLTGIIEGAVKGTAGWIADGLTGFWNWIFG